MFESETQITVRYKDVDKMGIVHHSNYLVYFEVGRTDFIKKLGKSYEDIEEKGILLPVVSLNIDYKKGAVYDEDIAVKTRLIALKAARCSFSYEIFSKRTGEFLCSGITVHAFTNTSLRPINVKKQALELYSCLCSALCC